MKKYAGFLTLVTIALIVIFGFLGIAITYMFVGSATGTINFQLGSQAFYIAEGGLEKAIRALETPLITGTAARVACTEITGDTNLTNSSLGNGAVTVTATGPFYPSTATTLNGALSNNATTITVVSTANYQSAGRIRIDREFINYTAKTATTFIGVTRGVDGTNATNHATGAPVAQLQCNLTATGGIPNVPSATNKRILTEAAQLQEVWVAGANSGPTFTMAQWNYPTELTWNDTSLPSGIATVMNGISMISNADGWAVGNSGRFLRWNGSAWSLTTVSPTITYRAIYCISSNNCFAGGDASGNAVILSWNGSTWSRITPTGIQANNINALHCADANNCWAVGTGTSNATRVFYRYLNGTWSTVNVNAALGTGPFPFRAVFCVTASDCWALGDTNFFAKWNGSSWSLVSAAAVPSVQYNSVYCNATDDCWAVGNASGGELIIHWDGASWTRNTVSGTIPNINLFGVTCINANDCWAVGAASSGEMTLHYDGTAWTRFGPVADIANVNLNAIDAVHPGTQPYSAWTESFP